MPSIGGSLGSLFVRLGLKTDDLDKGADKAKRSLFGVKESMRELRDDAGKVAVKVGAVGAALVGLVYLAGNAAREIRNLAAVSNTSTREFQRQAQAARTVGIESEKLADIYKNVSDRVGDFIQTGAGPMADFFEKIAPQVGVTAEQFARLSGPEALQLYVKSLEAANLSQQEMTFYLEKVASDSTKLLPLLRNDARGMRELGDAAEEAGRILSDLDLQELEDARNRIDDLKSSLGTEFMKLIADNADGILDLAEKLGELAIKAIEATSQMLKFFGIMKEDRVLELSKDLLDVQNELHNAERSAALRRREGDRERIMAEQRIVDLKEREAAISAELLKLEQEWHEEETQRQADAAAASANRGQAMTLTGRQAVSVRVTGGGGGDDVLDAEARRRGAIADDARARLDSVRDSLQTEAEAEQSAFEERMDALRDNLELRLITQDEFNALEQDLELAHLEEMERIRKESMDRVALIDTMSRRERTDFAIGEMKRMTAGVATQSKALFELNKAAAIAGAIVDSKEAIVGAYKVGAKLGGPYVGAAFAAVAAASTLAQINAIKSQTFGATGGAAPSLAGSTAATPVSNVGPGGGGQVISIQGLEPGSFFSGKAVRELLEQVNEAIKDGGRVVFNQ